MRKISLIIIIASLISACSQQTGNTALLENRIDSLETKLADTYKPGFGEFMGSIQAHHSKLWFAGTNQNWKLADFEIHEMKEAIDNIQKFATERNESKMVSLLNPALDSVNNAIQQKNEMIFKSSFVFLTNTCNNCHKETNFEFNVVKIPETSHSSNPAFKLTQ